MRDPTEARGRLIMRPSQMFVAACFGWVVLVSASGCAPPEDAGAELSVTWTVAPQPARVGSTVVAVQIADSLGRPVEGADVSIDGTMTHPGMQPVQAAARETAPGRYEGVLDLSMAGDWILLLEARLPDGRMVRRDYDLPGVRTN